MLKKVNKKFLEEMFSKAPQTTLGIKQILTLDTKKKKNIVEDKVVSKISIFQTLRGAN